MNTSDDNKYIIEFKVPSSTDLTMLLEWCIKQNLTWTLNPKIITLSDEGIK